MIPVNWPESYDTFPPVVGQMSDPPKQSWFRDAWNLAITRLQRTLGLNPQGRFSTVAARLNANAGTIRVRTVTFTFNNSAFSETMTFMGEQDLGPGGRYLLVLPLQKASGVLSLHFSHTGGTSSNFSLRAWHSAGPMNGTVDVDCLCITVP